MKKFFKLFFVILFTILSFHERINATETCDLKPIFSISKNDYIKTALENGGYVWDRLYGLAYDDIEFTIDYSVDNNDHIYICYHDAIQIINPSDKSSQFISIKDIPVKGGYKIFIDQNNLIIAFNGGAGRIYVYRYLNDKTWKEYTLNCFMSGFVFLNGCLYEKNTGEKHVLFDDLYDSNRNPFLYVDYAHKVSYAYLNTLKIDGYNCLGDFCGVSENKEGCFLFAKRNEYIKDQNCTCADCDEDNCMFNYRIYRLDENGRQKCYVDINSIKLNRLLLHQWDGSLYMCELKNNMINFYKNAGISQ